LLSTDHLIFQVFSHQLSFILSYSQCQNPRDQDHFSNGHLRRFIRESDKMKTSSQF